MKTTLKEWTSKLIINCYPFKNWNGETWFVIKYLNPIPTDETYQDKDWNTRVKRDNEHISSEFVSKKSLPAEMQKNEDSKICQEIKGKSIMKTTFLVDEK